MKKPYRLISVEGCEILGEGAYGTVYRLDRETVVKVYREGEKSLTVAETEQQESREAFLLGVPTAIPFGIVKVGDQYGSVFELIDAKNCNDLIVQDPSLLDNLVSRYASLLCTLHGLEDTRGKLPSARRTYLAALEIIGESLDAGTKDRTRQLLEEIPETHHLVHGDPQMKNVLLTDPEMIFIDLDHLCAGDPVFDLGALYATYITFNEIIPGDSLLFLKLPLDTATRIFHQTLLSYLEIRNGSSASTGLLQKDESSPILRRIQTLGYLRFLTILKIEQKDVQSDEKERQIGMAAEALSRLIPQVDHLSLLQP